jgi:hypothetical protein
MKVDSRTDRTYQYRRIQKMGQVKETGLAM